MQKEAAIAALSQVSLLENLFRLIQSGSVGTRENAFNAVANIAAVVDKDFGRFYDSFMPLAMQILQAQPSPAERTLRAKAIECIGLIAVAVGKERFAPQAAAVMRVLVDMLQRGFDADDPQADYVISTCARLCDCLGHDFVPYLGHVMPVLLKKAQFNDDEIVVSGDSQRRDRKIVDEASYHIVERDVAGVGSHFIGVNTAALQENVRSTELLLMFVYALSDVGTDFAPYVTASVEALLPGMQQRYLPQVRATSASAMPGLVDTAVKYSGQVQAQTRSEFALVVATVADSLLQAFVSEIDGEVKAVMVTAFKSALSI